MRRTVTLGDGAFQIIQEYMERNQYSFNKAVNEIIVKYAEAMSKGKAIRQKLVEARNIESMIKGIENKVEAIHRAIIK